MSKITILMYALLIVTFIAYLIIKYKKRQYLISPFNVGIYQYFFCLIIIPIFFYDSNSWARLGVNDASQYWSYLNQVFIINAIGFIVMICSLTRYELKDNSYFISNVYKLGNKINDFWLDIFFWPTILGWYFIVFKYNHGIPLLNDGRTFYINSGISPVYIALNAIVGMYGIYYGINIIYRKTDFIKWCIALLTSLFTGNRSTAIISILAPLIIIYLYRRKKLNYISKFNFKKLRKKTTRRIVISMFVLVLLGLYLQSIRNQQQGNFNNPVMELFYGNTFSDLRDGAFLLKGFREKFGNSFLFGKTIEAGLLSFIPSSMLSFKEQWLWGRFSTTGLFGWIGHGGLRGGWSLEAYMNFGMCGVIIFSYFQGLILGKLENSFYYIFITNNIKDNGKEYILLYLYSQFLNLFVCTAGLNSIYIEFFFMLVIMSLSSMVFVKSSKMQYKI